MGNLRDKYTNEEWDELRKRAEGTYEKALKKLHGGKRFNAGRKRQYKEETQTISFRVPKSLIEPITKYVKRALAKSKK